jgi:hypothetical protein
VYRRCVTIAWPITGFFAVFQKRTKIKHLKESGIKQWNIKISAVISEKSRIVRELREIEEL